MWSGMSIGVTFPSALPCFCMMLCIVSQVARRTHSHQVLRAYILRLMVQMCHRQRSPVRVEWFTRFPALLSTHLAFPFGFPLHIIRYSFPMYRIQLFIHRHRCHLLSACNKRMEHQVSHLLCLIGMVDFSYHYTSPAPVKQCDFYSLYILQKHRSFPFTPSKVHSIPLCLRVCYRLT